MKKISKNELEEILMETIEIYKKLQYTNSHEYFISEEDKVKAITLKDVRRMDDIIKYLELDK